MEKANVEIVRLFYGYIGNEVSLGDFQEQIAVAHWNVERAAPEMSSLVYKAVGKLAELSRGHRTEQSLRQELAVAIRSFEYVSNDVPLQQFALAANYYGPPISSSVLGNNTHFNVAA
jgi:hypothetical protein